MRARRGRWLEYALMATAAGGRSRGERKLVLLSGAASCPARRESRCLVIPCQKCHCPEDESRSMITTREGDGKQEDQLSQRNPAPIE